ncbi:MAG: helical backbone metal receptor [Bacteroidota bacterium]
MVVPTIPQRIVSLCPSITETLYALGLGKRIVGRTRFCIHPAKSVKQAVRVGGTKAIKFDRLHSLKPDLIIAEKEENTLEMVEILREDYPVYVIDVRTIEHVYRMIRDLGMLTGTHELASNINCRLNNTLSSIQAFSKPVSCFYLIWEEPLMVVGKDTFIDAMLSRLKLDNLGRQFSGRYPAISAKQLMQAKPDLILLSSEPFPYQEKHLLDWRMRCPQSVVELVDGEIFSWYGTHLLEAGAYLDSFSFQIQSDLNLKRS